MIKLADVGGRNLLQATPRKANLNDVDRSPRPMI